MTVEDILRPDRAITDDGWQVLLRRAGELLARASSNVDSAERIDLLIDAVQLCLALGAIRANEEGDHRLRDLLAQVGKGLSVEEGDELIATILGTATAFAYAPIVWGGELVTDRSHLRRIVGVESRARSFLRQAYVAGNLERSAARLAVAWLRPLSAGLASAVQAGTAALRESSLWSRLWSMRSLAERLGLTDAVPTLTEAVCVGEVSATTLPAPAAPDRAVQLLGGLDPHDALVREVVSAAVHGDLAATDIALVRRLLALQPYPWVTAHRRVFSRNGSSAAVCLEQSARGWRVPPLFQAEAAEVPPHEVLPETLRRPLPPPGAVLPIAGSFATEPARVAWEVRRAALAVREIPIAGAELALFADREGFWLRARVAEHVWKVRCEQDEASATGWHAQFPVVHVRDQRSQDVAIRDLLPLRAFRPGPLRPLLAAAGANVDRACAPRAYVVSVGESVLRSLLGKGFKSEVQQALDAAAKRADVQDGPALLDSLLKSDALAANWIGALPLSTAARAAADGDDLRALLHNLDRLTIDRIGTGPHAMLGAEIDTLLSAGGEWRPAAGDRVLLLASATGSGMLAARIIQAWLRTHIPAIRTRVEPCAAMRQPEVPKSDGYDLPQEPIVDTYRLVDAWLGRLLTKHAADPVVVTTGGVKWMILPLTEAAAARRVPVLYKALNGAPILFRWDQFRPSPPGGTAGDGPAAKRLVVTVGVSLLSNYHRERGQNAPVSPQTLLHWARAKGPASCAELTGFQAWRRRYGSSHDASEIDVAFIRTRSTRAGSDDEGQTCATVVAALIGDAGAHVSTDPAWDVPDLNEWDRPEDMLRLRTTLLEPVLRCLDADAEPSDVLISGGQKLTCAMTSLIARGRGYRSFFAPEDRDQGQAEIWLVNERSAPDGPLADALPSADLCVVPAA